MGFVPPKNSRALVEAHTCRKRRDPTDRFTYHVQANVVLNVPSLELLLSCPMGLSWACYVVASAAAPPRAILGIRGRGVEPWEFGAQGPDGRLWPYGLMGLVSLAPSPRPSHERRKCCFGGLGATVVCPCQILRDSAFWHFKFSGCLLYSKAPDP